MLIIYPAKVTSSTPSRLWGAKLHETALTGEDTALELPTSTNDHIISLAEIMLLAKQRDLVQAVRSTPTSRTHYPLMSPRSSPRRRPTRDGQCRDRRNHKSNERIPHESTSCLYSLPLYFACAPVVDVYKMGNEYVQDAHSCNLGAKLAVSHLLLEAPRWLLPERGHLSRDR